MSVSGVIAAAIAALLGACVWAVVLFNVEFELGWLAWGLGALVGFAARKFEGSGKEMGIICAVLTVLAIFLGKMMGFYFMLYDVADMATERALYEESLEDGRIFAALDGTSSYREYMAERGFTWEEGTPAEDISDAEVEEFRTFVVPHLQEFAANPPPFEEWREERRDELFSLSTLFLMLRDNLGLLDIVFVLLGVVTAFQIVNSAEETA